ncbi:ferredoxin-type protein NapG [Helicobacter cholecystus]|uniref:Ferredoxin-type protein NapG n=1 Tax=Helicobacter cholecystus TaxID=45498 RepID=A0A3D8IYY9_9HELI|nr:ferredoxin-type protein NapG [Helicobacter cholecystus]RDU70115.1 ferredoxin-type protein NapG [Helicobacter cholecystus]VEJ24707.1 NapG/MauM family ferredoxin-type protein [Helicobacter cholecystus]
MKKFNPERRKTILKWVGSVGTLGVGAMVWSMYLKGASKTDALRPPGAGSEEDFLSSCIRCGLCVEACPYLTLKLATPGSGISAGTPYFEPRKIPCYMCKDIPCTFACPSGALDIKRLVKETQEPSINEAKMGVAVIDTTHCIAYGGIQCDACYRACPLIGKAIYLELRHSKFTNEHSELLPMVNAEICTGCGMCERACVTQKPTIRVLRRERVLGSVGEHYIRSWKAGDEERIQENTAPSSPRQNALDYLNNGGF